MATQKTINRDYKTVIFDFDGTLFTRTAGFQDNNVYMAVSNHSGCGSHYTLSISNNSILITLKYIICKTKKSLKT